MEPVYSVAKAAFYPGLRWGLRWTIEGAQLVPPRGPVILASNHVSYLDPLVLAWLADRRNRRVRFLAKAELFDKRALGPLLRSVSQIPVLRGGETARDALVAAVAALERGECVVVFPEGTISTDLDPMPGKSGTARLARETGVPVLPVGLWGSHRIVTKGRRPDWRWGVHQAAVVGPPVRVRPGDHHREATDRIMGAVAAAVRRAREVYPDRPDGDAWWWRSPESARLRSCRSGADVSGPDR